MATALGYPRGRGVNKKMYDPVCFRWDDSAAVTATALAAYAAEHAEALMLGWEVPSLVIVGEGLGAAVGLELAQAFAAQRIAMSGTDKRCSMECSA